MKNPWDSAKSHGGDHCPIGFCLHYTKCKKKDEKIQWKLKLKEIEHHVLKMAHYRSASKIDNGVLENL